MSKNKGFSNTSANRYSLALYELSSESNLLVKVEDNSLAFLNLISKNKDFSNFVKDPTIKKDVLIEIIPLSNHLLNHDYYRQYHQKSMQFELLMRGYFENLFFF